MTTATADPFHPLRENTCLNFTLLVLPYAL